MNRARLSPIPHGLLDVEMAAYPLSTEEAFTHGLVDLDPQPNSPAARLWRIAEGDLRKRHPGIRVEQLTAVRDTEWFDKPGAPARSLTIWFRHLAARYLECRGTTFVPRNDRFPNSDPRWIVRILPPDFLAAGLWRDKYEPSHLDDISPSTAQNLRDGGFTETHLHVNAALDFGNHWINTLATLLDPQTDLERFQSPSGAFQEGRNLADWLLRAAITRQLLGEYLVRGADRVNDSFAKFVQFRWELETQRLGSTVILPLRIAIVDVIEGRLGECICAEETQTGLGKWMRWAFRKYCLTTASLPGGSGRGLHEFDPLNCWLPANIRARHSTELCFLSGLLRELEQQELTGQVDLQLQRAFWQTVRIRNIYYRHLTQGALTPGLAWFIRYCDRISPGRQSMSVRDLARVSSTISGAGCGLRYFEFRTSPPRSVTSAKQYISAFFRELSRPINTPRKGRNSSERSIKEAGLVYHFIRDGKGGKSKGNPHAFGLDAAANPAPGSPATPGGYRFQTSANTFRQEALVIARLLGDSPHLLRRLRAIDLCTDEHAIPLWVFITTFKGLREVSERTSVYLARHGHDVPPLRRTIHAGEDFPHLLTGLRQIDDSIQRLNLQSGDRLGHALALGYDPRRWATMTGASLISRETRLFDLTWEWDCRTGRRRAGLDTSRLALLEREIGDLSKPLFGQRLSAGEMVSLIEDLNNPQQLLKAGFPNGPLPQNRNPTLDRLVLYLTNKELFQQGASLVQVDPESESKCIEELQAWLRGQVARRGMAVEINPNSNFLIGNLGEWCHHPLFQMNPPGGGGVNPVPLVVGSDDPLVFASKLPDEYAALERALDEAGISKPDALRWLDETRTNGLYFRFTLPGSLDRIKKVPTNFQLLSDLGKLIP